MAGTQKSESILVHTTVATPPVGKAASGKTVAKGVRLLGSRWTMLESFIAEDPDKHTVNDVVVEAVDEYIANRLRRGIGVER